MRSLRISEAASVPDGPPCGGDRLDSCVVSRRPCHEKGLGRAAVSRVAYKGRRDNVPLGRGRRLQKGGCKTDHPPPSIVLEGTRWKVREDVQSGNVRAGETGLHGRGDGDTGSSAGVWTAPGHGEEDAEVLDTTGVPAEQAGAETEARSVRGGDRGDTGGGQRSA